MILSGLADLGIQINPSMIASAAATAAAQFKTLVPDQTTDIYSIGFTRRGLDVMRGQMTAAWELRLKATQQELLAKFGDQLKPSSTLYGSDGPKYCERAARTGYIDMLYPIGVIVEMGIPFTPNELSGEGTLFRAYKPTPEQRFLASWGAYAQSQVNLAKMWGKDLAQGSDLYLDLVSPDRGIQALVNKSDASVMDAIKLRDARGYLMWTDDAPGLTANPITATDEELNGKDGLKKYYARGGFLWDRRVLDGRWPVGHSNLTWGEGYFLCEGSGLPAMKLLSASGDEGYGYDKFIKITPTEFTLRIAPKDAPWFADVAGAIGRLIKNLMDFICGNRAEITAISATVLLAQTCVGPDGKSVPPGTPGSKCTSPTGPQVAAVAAGAVLLNAVCGAVTTKPHVNTAFTPPPDSETIKLPTSWLMPLIALGVLGVGAAVLLTRKR